MKTKSEFSGLLALLVFCTATAQEKENFLFYEVQKAKQADAVFQDISASVVKASIDKSALQKQFINGSEIGVIQYSPAKGKELGIALCMTVPLKNKDVVLEIGAALFHLS